MERRIQGGQGGFTLIEVIAVLVILGILAAVAVPRFVDLQETAKEKALDGAFAAGASQLYMQYASDLLTSSGSAATTWDYSASDFVLGDFKASLTGACGDGASSVTITEWPYEGDLPDDGTETKSFTICESP